MWEHDDSLFDTYGNNLDGVTATGVTTATTATAATAAVTGLWGILFGLACKMCRWVFDIYLCEETGK